MRDYVTIGTTRDTIVSNTFRTVNIIYPTAFLSSGKKKVYMMRGFILYILEFTIREGQCTHVYDSYLAEP